MPVSPLCAVRDGNGWRTLLASQVWHGVEIVARGLVAAGIEPGDRVGIMSRTRYEWLVADFALWTVGAVPVPLYESSSPEQIAWIAQDARLVAMFVEDDEMRRRAADAWPDLIAHGGPWVFDEDALGDLAIAGGTVPPAAVQERWAALRGEDLATIVYTSGTTGRPRGARITHANLAVHARNTAQGLPSVVSAGEPRLLLFLPLAHVYARVIALVCVASRTTIGFSPSATTLADDARTFRPTFLVVVPRVLEKVHAAAQAAAGEGARRRLFTWAATIAVARSRARAADPAARDGVREVLADWLVLDRLRRMLGGRLRTVIVGGAALHPPLAHFFRGTGIDVLEGYGLTETCAQTTVSRPGAVVVGSVGTPLPGCRVRIGDDGRILVAGPHVFAGYEGEPPREGEWFDTGDLGRLDADGNLYVTGRAKDILVTASGKNVAPGPLEDAVRSHPLVAECLVVGEGRPFVAALLALDEEALANWCARHGRPSLTLAEANDDPALRAELTRAVAAANASVSRAESIREFVVLDHALTVAGGQLTPSLKVRRTQVLAGLAPVVDELYAQAAARRAC
jgi:long-chain acyl-CoA synthetase